MLFAVCTFVAAREDTVMELLRVTFAVSGVTTWVFFPPVVAFLVSTLTCLGGVSGAFLLLPFQVSVLQFTSPSVSATNFVYNIVAIPSGVYRYIREGRMAWPLTWVLILGTLPGVLLGYYLRVLYLPDPRAFKMFVGCVLLYIGSRLFYEMGPWAKKGKEATKLLEARFREQAKKLRDGHTCLLSAGLPSEAVVKTVELSLRKVVYEFWGQRFSFSVPGMFFLALVVGIVGGTYGIGGGAIIAPFCVGVFGLPVYTVAGATLMATFLTSVTGVVLYSVLPAAQGIATSPDWPLGFLFGLGGFAGTYCGARLQKYVPQSAIKCVLSLLILFLAGTYILQFFR